MSRRRRIDLNAIVSAAGNLGRKKRKAATLIESPPYKSCIKKQKISAQVRKQVKFDTLIEVRSHTSEDESSDDEQVRSSKGKSPDAASGLDLSFAQRRAAQSADESRRLSGGSQEDGRPELDEDEIGGQDDHQDQTHSAKKCDGGIQSAKSSYSQSVDEQVTSDSNPRPRKRQNRQNTQQSNTETVAAVSLEPQPKSIPLTPEEHLTAFMSSANQPLTRKEMNEAVEHAKLAGGRLGWDER